MKRVCLAVFAALLFSGSASAAGWQSLGRLNALTATPDPVLCQQRVINHYWSSKPTYYPTAVNAYWTNNIQFVFDLDVSALSKLVSNSPSNSRFPTAVNASNPTYYPTAVNVYWTNNIQFVFDLDVSALSKLVSNSPANSRFPTAVNAYNAQTGAKSLYGTVSVGQYPGVGINASYVDASGLVQGLGWSVVASELQYYEVQQFCPQ